MALTKKRSVEAGPDNANSHANDSSLYLNQIQMVVIPLCSLRINRPLQTCTKLRLNLNLADSFENSIDPKQWQAHALGSAHYQSFQSNDKSEALQGILICDSRGAFAGIKVLTLLF